MTAVRLLCFFASGAGLGGLYFGGLWFTVQRIPAVRRPRLLLVGSFLVRTAVVLAGFYAVIRFAAMQWEGIAAAFLGFVIARFVLVRRWRPSVSPRTEIS